MEAAMKNTAKKHVVAEYSEIYQDIYLIPIKPNSKNWTEPDFQKFGTAYPQKWGYGHEEWNNSKKNDFIQNGKKWHAFHSQGFSNIDSKSFNQTHKIFVFISSSNGIFNGLAIAPILNSEREAKNIGIKVHLKNRGIFLWNGIHKALPKLKKSEFTKKWNKSLDGWRGGFRWKVLKNNFIWFDKPIMIKRTEFDSRQKWSMHYNTPQKLSPEASRFFWELLRKKDTSLNETLANIEIDQYDPNELIGTCREEGAKRKIWINVYERSKKNRDDAIKAYGNKYCCDICKFNFEKVYGEIGKNFIHVHHIIPLSSIPKNYKINPAKDLVPVCPNCHAMLHRNGFKNYEKFKAQYINNKKKNKKENA